MTLCRQCDVSNFGVRSSPKGNRRDRLLLLLIRLLLCALVGFHACKCFGNIFVGGLPVRFANFVLHRVIGNGGAKRVALVLERVTCFNLLLGVVVLSLVLLVIDIECHFNLWHTTWCW